MIPEGILPIILGAVILVFAVLGNIFIRKLNKKQEQKPSRHPIHLKEKFFGKYDLSLYRCLHSITNDIEGVEVFTKVRWEDVWNAQAGAQRARYRGFLKSRRVDFIIVKTNENKPSIIIEIQKGKGQEERKQRLKEFCKDTNLHLLFVQSKEYYNKEELKVVIKQCLEGKEMVLEV